MTGPEPAVLPITPPPKGTTTVPKPRPLGKSYRDRSPGSRTPRNHRQHHGENGQRQELRNEMADHGLSWWCWTVSVPRAHQSSSGGAVPDAVGGSTEHEVDQNPPRREESYSPQRFSERATAARSEASRRRADAIARLWGSTPPTPCPQDPDRVSEWYHPASNRPERPRPRQLPGPSDRPGSDGSSLRCVFRRAV
jgi:hypothetical protein